MSTPRKIVDRLRVRSAERICGPNNSQRITVPRHVLKDWFAHGFVKGFESAERRAKKAAP